MEDINPKWSKSFEVSCTPIEMLEEKNPPETPRTYYNEIFYIRQLTEMND
jgi:hypothetical protein